MPKEPHFVRELKRKARERYFIENKFEKLKRELWNEIKRLDLNKTRLLSYLIREYSALLKNPSERIFIVEALLAGLRSGIHDEETLKQYVLKHLGKSDLEKESLGLGEKSKLKERINGLKEEKELLPLVEVLLENIEFIHDEKYLNDLISKFRFFLNKIKSGEIKPLYVYNRVKDDILREAILRAFPEIEHQLSNTISKTEVKERKRKQKEHAGFRLLRLIDLASSLDDWDEVIFNLYLNERGNRPSGKELERYKSIISSWLNSNLGIKVGDFKKAFGFKARDSRGKIEENYLRKKDVREKIKRSLEPLRLRLNDRDYYKVVVTFYRNLLHYGPENAFNYLRNLERKIYNIKTKVRRKFRGESGDIELQKSVLEEIKEKVGIFEFRKIKKRLGEINAKYGTKKGLDYLDSILNRLKKNR